MTGILFVVAVVLVVVGIVVVATGDGISPHARQAINELSPDIQRLQSRVYDLEKQNKAQQAMIISLK